MIEIRSASGAVVRIHGECVARTQEEFVHVAQEQLRIAREIMGAYEEGKHGHV